MHVDKKPCIVIAGPTACGKTALSVALAKKIGGAVVSADSMQVYKGMNIGSAKVSEKEMGGIKHYLIDVLDPKDEFNVVCFQEMAKKAMNEIWEEGLIPIITGGTGFYIQALLKDIDFKETGAAESRRNEYERIAREDGAEVLHGLLMAKDPKAAEILHPNDIKRVIRALEFIDESGSSIILNNEEQKEKESPYKYVFFVLSDDRQLLYERINKRVDEMIEEGLLEEVSSLKDRGLRADDISMKGIGYREFFPYFDGEITYDEAVENIKKDTRHFAKRQITWFKREKDALWINRQDFDNNNEKILEYMTEKWKEIYYDQQ